MLNGVGVADSYKALVRLLANTPIYNKDYPFTIINGTRYPLINQHLNYTPVHNIIFLFKRIFYFNN